MNLKKVLNIHFARGTSALEALILLAIIFIILCLVFFMFI